MRGLRKILISVVVMLVLWALLGFVVLPLWLPRLIAQQASATLGRTVSVQAVRCNPFTLQLTVEAMRVAAASPDKPALFDVKTLRVDVDGWSSLRHGGLVLSALQVDAPRVHIARLADQHFDFSDIVNRLAEQPSDPSAAPLHFSLNNIQVQDAEVVFDDQPVRLQHRVELLQIGLPFISNFPAKVATRVSPHVSARVNGTAVALTGALRPFAAQREAILKLELAPVDVVPYLAYLPKDLPLKLSRGHLTADLECVWSEQAQSAGQHLSLRGLLALSEVGLQLPGEQAHWLDFRRLALRLRDVQPLARPLVAEFAELSVFAPHLALQRLPDGRLKGLSAAAKGPTTVPSTPPPSTAKPAPAPRIVVDKLSLRDGQVAWQDAAVAGGFSSVLEAVTLSVRNFQLGQTTAKVPAASLEASLQSTKSGTLSLQGSLQPASGEVDLQLALRDLQLAAYRPYYAALLGAAQLAAVLEASGRLRAGRAQGVQVQAGRLALADLRLPETGQTSPILRSAKLVVDGIDLDLAAQRLSIATVSERDTVWRIVRDESGINLLRTLGLGQSSAAPAASAAASSTSKPWQYQVGKVDVSGWHGSFEERSNMLPGGAPVKVAVRDLSLLAQNISNVAGSRLQWKSSAGVNQQGRLALSGGLDLSALQGFVQVNAQHLDLLLSQPYLRSYAKVLLTRGSVDVVGKLDFDVGSRAAPKFAWQGDVAVRDLNTFDELNDADFVRWKTLELKQLSLQTAPLAVSVENLRLDDFYTRLILDAQGRFNLRELTQSTPPPNEVASAPITTEANPHPLTLRMQRVAVSNGRVNFSDRFIKPNYDANLTELNGSLVGLSSDPTSLATLQLNGLVDRAPVNVVGQLNPLRQDRYLDLKAAVSDIDLTGVSAYAARYLGYGISKGRFSMDVAYRIRERKLSAENQLRLDQLTFGEKVESAEALNVPVRLAVALLKDRNGVIEVNLPVSGTLDDPQFSVGRIVWQALGNLLRKAVSSPFTVLGSLAGGAEQLDSVAFEAGQAQWQAASQRRLEALARALVERPNVALEISASVAPATDELGLRQMNLQSRLRELKAAALLQAGESVSEVDTLPLSDAERPALLAKLYQQATFAKPKNLLGLDKELPVADMEQSLLAASRVSESDLRALARSRAQAVRQWLLTQGKIPLARLFVVEASGDQLTQGAKVSFAVR